LRNFLTLLIISGVTAFWLLRPIRETDFSSGGFTPMRDDALAIRYAPVVKGHALYGAPLGLLYRMARSEDGDIHIAYHPFYGHEENPHSGFGAFLSRILYTGGLNLKNILFGPGDVELIEVVLNKRGQPRLVAYEDAGDYRPQNFGVRHVQKSVKDPLPPFCFETVSWNHMFALAGWQSCAGVNPLKPVYFGDDEWEKYRMVKKTEAILRRNRMHRPYERRGAP
jgi:hypothetical protein